jgi:hypothetical protein
VPQGKWDIAGHPLPRSGFPHQHQRSSADLRRSRRRVFTGLRAETQS